nr:hypothetical protein [Tanacetum cinerariifolium]
MDYLVKISKKNSTCLGLRKKYRLNLKNDMPPQDKMDDSSITMEEYIRLEEEKARKHRKVFNWEIAKYGKIWYDEDVHDLRSVETEFPAIVFNDNLTLNETLFCEPTVPGFRVLSPDIADFKERLERIHDMGTHRARVLDFEGMLELVKITGLTTNTSNVIKKMENGVWNLIVKSTNLVGYTHLGMVLNEEKKIESLMDQMVRVTTARQAKNKRMWESTQWNKHVQQPPRKRQNLARAYIAGPEEKKTYDGNLPYCNKLILKKWHQREEPQGNHQPRKPPPHLSQMPSLRHSSTKALSIHDRSQNDDDNHNSGTSSRKTERTTRKCTYTDFLKCQPMNFKGTEGVELALMCGKMFPEEYDKIEKYVDGLPDMIHERLMASKPKKILRIKGSKMITNNNKTRGRTLVGTTLLGLGRRSHMGDQSHCALNETITMMVRVLSNATSATELAIWPVTVGVLLLLSIRETSLAMNMGIKGTSAVTAQS